jgi:cellobiose-specific phosphotransferase system component IIC
MSRLSVAWKPSFAGSKQSAGISAARALAALHALAETPFLSAVRDALPWAFAALVAAFVSLLGLVPAPLGFSATAITQRISLALLPAFGIMACALAVALPLAMAKRARYSRTAFVAGTIICFALALPHANAANAIAYLRDIGGTGIFLAILMTGFVSLAVLLTQRDWLGDALAVAAVAGAIFVAHVDVSREIALMLQPLARMGDSLPAFLAIVAVAMLFWSIGVHGPAMLAAVVTPVYLTLQMQNTTAFAAHDPLPHLVVVSLFLFVAPGGSGATLPLAILLALSRIPRLRKLGKAVLLPAFANVNEPLIFGLPIVLNPFFLVPFIGIPVILACVTYAAVAHGIVARAAFYVPSSVPAPLAAYLATLDPRAVLLLCLNLVIALVLYLPFVRAYEHHVETSGA